MPQDGSSNYQYPPGTPGITDQIIESAAYNSFLDDLVNNDLNIPRPIHRGGTGAGNANNALANLNGSKAAQLVTDYASHVWLPGSFYSATSATAAPVAGHAFAGVCYINEAFAFPPTNANVVVEARDESDTVVPGRVYVRQKKAGVWDAAWSVQSSSVAEADAAYVNATGDTMTGLLTLSGDPTASMHASTKQYVDGGVAGVPGKVSKAGDTMTGFLTLSGDPTAILHAATKQYVDGGVGGVGGGLTAKVDKAGDTMTGPLLGPTTTLGGAGSLWAGLYLAGGAGPFTITTAANYRASTASKILTADQVWAAAAPVALTEVGGAVTPDLSLNIDMVWTLLGAGRTINNPINLKAGQKGLIYVVPGATGTITTWGTAYRFSGGTKPTLTPSGTDIISYAVGIDGTTMFCSFAPDFK